MLLNLKHMTNDIILATTDYLYICDFSLCVVNGIFFSSCINWEKFNFQQILQNFFSIEMAKQRYNRSTKRSLKANEGLKETKFSTILATSADKSKE